MVMTSKNTPPSNQSNFGAMDNSRILSREVDAGGNRVEDFESLVLDVGRSFTTYCYKRPGVAACLLFLGGFYVGWKVKPW
ncbi:MAG: hypothetical protein KDB22_24715 [Planctomycetales bacterium]|nr:hypothetical protein [Planctomycetales bacterium]